MLRGITMIGVIVAGHLAPPRGDAIGLGDAAVTAWAVRQVARPARPGPDCILRVLYFASPERARVGINSSGRAIGPS